MVQDKKTIADLLPPPDEDGLYMVQDDTEFLAELPPNFDEMVEHVLRSIREKDAQRA